MSTPSEPGPGQDDTPDAPAPDREPEPTDAPGPEAAPASAAPDAPPAAPAPSDGWSAVDRRLGTSSAGYEPEPTRGWPTPSGTPVPPPPPGAGPPSPYGTPPGPPSPYGTPPGPPYPPAPSYGAGPVADGPAGPPAGYGPTPGYSAPGYPAPGSPVPSGDGPTPGYGAGPYAAPDPFRASPASPPPPGYGIGPGQGYAPPPGWVTPGPAREPLALASMIVGIVSVFCLFFLGPVAVGLGIVGLRRIRARGSEGTGMAVAGIATGSVTTLLAILFVIGMLADSGSI